MHRHVFTTSAPSREAGSRSITKMAARLQRRLAVTALASALDREADARLFLGHVAAAERLSHQARRIAGGGAMNRQQRRSAARGSRDSLSFIPCTRENLARAAMGADQAQQPGIAALTREMMRGGLALIYVTDRAAAIDLDGVTEKHRATVLIIGDDDHASTGPAGWKCAEAVAAWGACAVIHAAGATAETYLEAARGGRILGACVLVETDTAHAEQWTALFVGKPTLLVLPRGGVHPLEQGTRH